MRNQRLTISALALILVTGCGDAVSISQEMLDLRGTWLVATWSVMQDAAPNAVVDLLADLPAGGGVTDAGLYFYDGGTLLSIVNFPDTAHATLPSTTLDASVYTLSTWCLASAANVDFCAIAEDGDLVIDEGDADEQIWTFTRNGDDMVITGAAEYDFGTGDEPATFVMTLDNIILDNPRPDLLDWTNN